MTGLTPALRDAAAVLADYHNLTDDDALDAVYAAALGDWGRLHRLGVAPRVPRMDGLSELERVTVRSELIVEAVA